MKDPNIYEVLRYWPLFGAVLVGGQCGSLLASGPAPGRFVRRLTAAFTLFVGVRLLRMAY